MTLNRYQDDPAQARQFSTFADDLVDGNNPMPRDDTEHTFVTTAATLGPALRTTSALPSHDRQAIWENLMDTAVTSPDQRSARSNVTTIGTPWQQSAATPRALPQWHSTLSLIVVCAFLAGIVGLAYLRGPGQERDPSPGSSLGQVTHEGSDDTIYLQPPGECTGNEGNFTTDEELLTRSMSDWPEPMYTPVKVVTPDVGNDIMQTYLRYIRCTHETSEGLNWRPGTPIAYEDLVSPVAMSYLSERYRFVEFLADELPAEEQEAIETFACQPRVTSLLEGFPLPVNHPVEYAVLEQSVDNIPHTVYGAFTASDVYLLPDGRYGAMIGTITSADLARWLQGDEEVAAASSLRFVAFVEHDGTYLIDEEFGVRAAAEGWPMSGQEECGTTAG